MRTILRHHRVAAIIITVAVGAGGVLGLANPAEPPSEFGSVEVGTENTDLTSRDVLFIVRGTVVENDAGRYPARNEYSRPMGSLTLRVDEVVWLDSDIEGEFDYRAKGLGIPASPPVPEVNGEYVFSYLPLPGVGDVKEGAGLVVGGTVSKTTEHEGSQYSLTLHFTEGTDGTLGLVSTNEHVMTVVDAIQPGAPTIKDLVALYDEMDRTGTDGELAQTVTAAVERVQADIIAAGGSPDGVPVVKEEPWDSQPYWARNFRADDPGVPRELLDRANSLPLSVEIDDALLDRDGILVFRNSGGVILAQVWSVGSHVDSGMFIPGEDVEVVQMSEGFKDEGAVLGTIPFSKMQDSPVGVAVTLTSDSQGNVMVDSVAITSQNDLLAERDRIARISIDQSQPLEQP